MSEGPLDRAYAEKLDAADPLAAYRERFLLEDPALIYLNGNSLGPLPRATLARIRTCSGRNGAPPWPGPGTTGPDLPARAGDLVGELVGAAPGR